MAAAGAQDTLSDGEILRVSTSDTQNTLFKYQEGTEPSDNTRILSILCAVSVMLSRSITLSLCGEVSLTTLQPGLLAHRHSLSILAIYLPGFLITPSTRRRQQYWRTVELGTDWLTVTRGADVEVIAVTAIVSAEWGRTGKAIWRQHAHRFG